jgi:hypothetical protein
MTIWCIQIGGLGEGELVQKPHTNKPTNTNVFLLYECYCTIVVSTTWLYGGHQFLKILKQCGKLVHLQISLKRIKETHLFLCLLRLRFTWISRIEVHRVKFVLNHYFNMPFYHEMTFNRFPMKKGSWE